MRAIPASLLALFLASAGVPASAADLSVDLKNDTALSVSVRAGTDNGVTPAADFEIVASDNHSVAIYPVELFRDRFWSQPLDAADYERVKAGMPVRPVTLDPVSHGRIRAEGSARLKELRAKAEEARRAVRRQKIEDLRRQRERLLERRDALDDRIAAAERDLSEEEGRADWIMSSADDDIDRALQRIGELADERDELQSRRDSLSQQRPYPRADIERLSSQIRTLNDRIDSERSRIRLARERKRSARSSYLSRKQERQKLVAERNALTNELRQIDRKIRDLSEGPAAAGEPE